MQQLKEALLAFAGLATLLASLASFWGLWMLDCHARMSGKLALMNHQVRVSGLESMNSLQV